MSSDLILRGLFRSLVARIGGVDAAAAFMGARCGGGSKGHVSKMCAGHAGITVEAVIALEDAVGEMPVTHWLALRSSHQGLPMSGRSVVEMTGHAAMACGAAQTALARALDDQGPGGAAMTGAERAEIAAAAVHLRKAADDLLAAAEDARVLGTRVLGAQGFVPVDTAAGRAEFRHVGWGVRHAG